MIPVLQKLLVIVLVLLQSAAPLIHAHSGDEIDSLGVHIPGLESFALGTDVVEFSSIDRHFDHSQCIVTVNSAIQQKNQTCFGEIPNPVLSQPDLIFRLALLDYLINFSPQADQPFFDSLISQHNSRAPPPSLSYLL